MRIIIDCYGGDYCPKEAVAGAIAALNKLPELSVILTGYSDELNALLQEYKYDKGRLEQIGRVLERYIPSVEKMQTQLKRYEKAFTQTVEENKALRAENAKLEKAQGDTQRRLNLYRFEGEKLRRDYKEALRVLERVPREVLSAYTKGETKRAGRQGAEHGDR